MQENGFYILDNSYLNLIKNLGGTYNDNKARPIFCCLKDKYTDGLYWLIPTSDLSHRTPQQIQKYKNYNNFNDIRSSYYFIGTTSKPALFKISNALPVSDKYIARDYTVQGAPLVMKNTIHIAEIQSKLNRILAYEATNPNKFEQHISALKEFVCNELNQEHAKKINNQATEISNLKQTNVNLQTANDLLQKTVDDLRGEINDMRNRLDESIKNIETLKSENQRLQGIVDNTQKFINENPIVKKEFMSRGSKKATSQSQDNIHSNNLLKPKL